MEHAAKLTALFDSQPLAVLATQSAKTGAYANLVAFAASDDLHQLIFATPRLTRKYYNLQTDPKAALLIDSRANRQSDFNEAIAVTAIGKASECTSGDRKRFGQIYLKKHPNLAQFIENEDTALIKLTVEEFIIAGFHQTRRVIVN